MIAIYEPHPPENLYLSSIFYPSLVETGKAEIIWEGLHLLKNRIVIINSNLLNATHIDTLKGNGCRIVVFDINDHSTITHTYRYSGKIKDIDLIFKVAGLQMVQTSKELRIKLPWSYETFDLPFCGDEEWKEYCFMRDTGRMLSLPYVPWDATYCTDIKLPKINKILVRGGNHFLRYIMFLHMVHSSLVDDNSGFFASCYPACPRCRKAGHIPYGGYKDWFVGCDYKDLEWSKGTPPHLFNEGRGAWNNKCIPSFYALADIFQEAFGLIDMNLVDKALHKSFIGDYSFYDMLSNYAFFADYKWIHSIYAPPRFWQAVMCGSVNIISNRAGDQVNFPPLIAGEHYLTFEEDFSDISKFSNFDMSEWMRIAKNAMDAFREYIYTPTRHSLSRKLSGYIIEKIDSTVGA